mmetsp:Transcript_114099/g.271608  ORF Transcript_114099/g.271608 Transcript_114099/m.271608 type:complete len:329 (-) Transcript_114099:415-1401(-)
MMGSIIIVPGALLLFRGIASVILLTIVPALLLSSIPITIRVPLLSAITSAVTLAIISPLISFICSIFSSLISAIVTPVITAIFQANCAFLAVITMFPRISPIISPVVSPLVPPVLSPVISASLAALVSPVVSALISTIFPAFLSTIFPSVLPAVVSSLLSVIPALFATVFTPLLLTVVSSLRSSVMAAMAMAVMAPLVPGPLLAQLPLLIQLLLFLDCSANCRLNLEWPRSLGRHLECSDLFGKAHGVLFRSAFQGGPAWAALVTVHCSCLHSIRGREAPEPGITLGIRGEVADNHEALGATNKLLTGLLVPAQLHRLATLQSTLLSL